MIHKFFGHRIHQDAWRVLQKLRAKGSFVNSYDIDNYFIVWANRQYHLRILRFIHGDNDCAISPLDRDLVH